MFAKTLLPLIALAASTLAISITSPPGFSSWDISKDIPIVWTSVNTDPSVITIQLVNFASYPTVTQTLASNIATSDDKYTIKAKTLTVTGTAFQINFVSTTPQNSGILAQTGQFNLTASTSSSSSSSSSSSTSSSSSSSSASTSSTTSSTSTTPTTTVVVVQSTPTSTFTTSSTSSAAPFPITNSTSVAPAGTGSGGSTATPTPYTGNAGVSVRVGGGAVIAAAVFVAAFFA